jgi:hypothetical protein
MKTLKINGVTIVLVGAFNPKIFHPAWFALQELLPEAEVEQVQDLVSHPEITFCRLPWFEMQVTPTQFIASSAQESHFKPLRDLVQGTFEILQHTPVTQVGVNLEQHYLAETENEWNAFGDKLAPKKLWRKIMKDPGMVKLRVIDKGPRADGLPGTVQIDVESSKKMKNGIFILVNQHFECGSAGVSNAEAATQILSMHFEPTMAKSQEMVNTLLQEE